jgi:pimeloyl-ACP methyl ester carboxylesterase
MLTFILRLLAIGLIVTAVLLLAIYLLDINQAYERVRGKSTIIPSPYGDIEYTEGGTGPDVLVIHGAGGGYDQGELLGQALLGDRFHRITPSRFGYLRSTFHDGATFEDQAHAYATLLDHLGIQKVAVVAFSAGGPSAELFALLHPERVSSLTLVSCTTTALSSTEEQKQSDQKAQALLSIVKYDLPYWIFIRLYEKQFMGLMGVNDTVIAGLTLEQRGIVERYIAYMHPASLRAAGAAFDYNAPLVSGDRLAGIQAPTLIIHAADDTLQPYDHAAFATSTISNARLMRFERGGHFLFVIEQPVIRTSAQKHILDNVGELHTPSQ